MEYLQFSELISNLPVAQAGKNSTASPCEIPPWCKQHSGLCPLPYGDVAEGVGKGGGKTKSIMDEIFDCTGVYSVKLEKVNSPDINADRLAERIGGESRVKFTNDPKAREFDAISNEYIAQAKPALSTLNKSVRNQM